MKRKYVFGLFALFLLTVVIVYSLTPSATRALFFSEFRHRAGLMMGYEPEPVGDGTQGLRLERPEEYGPQPGGPAEDADEQETESTE